MPKGSMSTEGETLQVLSYLTGARYVHPWWCGRCQSCNQVPATHVAEGKHVNRGRDTPSFCPTLQVLDMSTLGEATDVNRVIEFLPHTCNVCGRNLITGLTSAASPKADMSSTCKSGQKLGVSLPLLICSTSVWPSRLLYRRGRKSRKELWISLYVCVCVYTAWRRLDVSRNM